MKTLYLFATLFLLLLLSACAPQKYQTRYAYTPPASPNGSACVQRCNSQQNQCKQRFSAVANQCQQRARQQAAKEMPGRIAAYEAALSAWEARMERYERELWFYKLRRNDHSILREVAHDKCRGRIHKNDKNCRHYHRPRWRGAYLGKPSYPGKAPRRPTLAAITTAIAAKTCQQQNQCHVDYNQCYAACGGTVKPYQVLLGN